MGSVLIAMQLELHRVKGICCRSLPCESGEELVVRHTLISLWDLYAARWRTAAGALALVGGGEAIPAGLQTHGQSPLPPARKKTGAEGARGGSSRTVEGRLGC